MGSTPEDRRVNQIRDDVDGLYELAAETKETTDKIQKQTDKIECFVRGNSLRLHRLEKTCGRSFGLLLAAQRQHTQRLDRVESLLCGLTAQMDQNGSQVIHLDSKVAHLDSKVTDLDSKVTDLDSKVTDLDSKVTHLDSKVTDLDTKVTHLDSKVTDLDSKVTHLDSKVTDLDSKVTHLDSKVTDLDTKVTYIDSKLTRLDSKVTGLESQVSQLDVVVRQNSQTLDLVVELLQKKQPPPH
ncbi:hypothetical protein [Nocardia sp. NPDC049149]|uniref:hypothetical protein n=1 Tax=Nocardia sp. NPDC049149 TaxID=3364315 RepID=UPI0037170EFF